MESVKLCLYNNVFKLLIQKINVWKSILNKTFQKFYFKVVKLFFKTLPQIEIKKLTFFQYIIKHYILHSYF